MRNLIRNLTSALIITFAMAAPLWAMAPSYPNKPIRIIVPFTAGGPVDGVARAVGRLLSDAIGQPVIVENKPGANTIIGADLVAKSPPDGYTLLMASDSTISINPFVYAKLPYSGSDFVPLTVVAHIPEYLFIGADVPANTLQEFIALAKSKPGKLNYASYGKGSSAHLEFEAFMAATGTELVHVPYKGAAESYPAILAGQIEAAIGSVVVPLPHIRAGKIKALAVMGEQRTTLLPNVPTFKEAGLPGFDANPWLGLLAPAATPLALVERLTTEITKIIGTANFRERYIDAVGLAPAPSGEAYFANVLKDDRERYAKYVKFANILPE